MTWPLQLSRTHFANSWGVNRLPLHCCSSHRHTLRYMSQMSCEGELDSGNTAWLLISSALVLLMTLPGLTLLYGSLTHRGSRITALAQVFVTALLVGELWFIAGYSVVFTHGNAFIGGTDRLWMKGSQNSTFGVNSRHPLNCTVPESVFMLFQGGFAVIAAALIIGSLVQRVKTSAIILFVPLWHLVVYCLVARWAWSPEGFLYKFGNLDFAGGDVVHITAGVSGLVAAWRVGPRKTSINQNGGIILYKDADAITGASLLLIGWLGFNGGSSGAADGRAGMAALATWISASTSALVWLALEWAMDRPSLVGLARCPL